MNPFRYRGYYYETETGFYYLQSRYYDPQVGRFINADEPTLVSAAQGNLLGTNLYTYCGNNPIIYNDITGYAPARLVGAGIQIELSIGWKTFGVEFVWYFDSTILAGRSWYEPYCYTYGGGGLTADLTSIISKISKNPSLLFNPKGFTKASASISIFAIFGYSNFTKPIHYEGAFAGVSLTIWNKKAYTSWSSTCFVVGLGVSTSTFSSSSAGTYYVLNSNVMSYLSNLYNTVIAKAKTL